MYPPASLRETTIPGGREASTPRARGGEWYCRTTQQTCRCNSFLRSVCACACVSIKAHMQRTHATHAHTHTHTHTPCSVARTRRTCPSHVSCMPLLLLDGGEGGSLVAVAQWSPSPIHPPFPARGRVVVAKASRAPGGVAHPHVRPSASQPGPAQGCQGSTFKRTYMHIAKGPLSILRRRFCSGQDKAGWLAALL